MGDGAKIRLVPRLSSCLALLLLISYAAKASVPQPTLKARTAGMTHMPGLLALDWDATTGKLYLEISRFDQDLLYLHSLPCGVGSNDLGLDRGQVSPGVVFNSGASAQRCCWCSATSLGDPLQQQFILRHRLLKKDPNCQNACEPVKPIQYIC